MLLMFFGIGPIEMLILGVILVGAIVGIAALAMGLGSSKRNDDERRDRD